MIKILVVDDSAFMRKAISMMLERDPEIRVVDTARDGLEAIEKVKKLDPDLVTMDVEMPRLDGISALKQIMREHPCPVLMISSLTKEGAQATIEALSAGAVDFIPKQLSYVSLDITRIENDLIEKVKSIARSRSRLFRRYIPKPLAGHKDTGLPPFSQKDYRIVTIGVSTGGPFALQHVVPVLPADLSLPVVIVQHMPPHFTRSMAERLNAMSALEVREAEDGMELKPGTITIAQGGRHLVFQGTAGRIVARTPDEPSASLHRPSVDVMFESANRLFDGHILSVIMTGMGKDGLQGARAIKESGGTILVQDEETSVVYGMPRAIVEAGIADAILPLDQIAPVITRTLNRRNIRSKIRTPCDHPD